MSMSLLLPIYWRDAWVSVLLVTSIDCKCFLLVHTLGILRFCVYLSSMFSFRSLCVEGERELRL